MNPLHPLKTALLDLSRAVGDEIPLIVGGGFGLYLRQEQLRLTDEQTLFEQLPEPRATNDIDLFVTMEVLVRLESVKVLQQRIEQLQFNPVPGAEYFQWEREDDEGRKIKIDLLCGPLGDYADQLHTDSLPRVRPKAPKRTLRFHARHTDEAIELDNRAEALTVTGQCSEDKPVTRTVFLPHPFTYLMMKLFAFDDRKGDVVKDAGRHHAMDLYRIVGMMRESEYEEALSLGKTYHDDPRVRRAREIASEHFAERTAIGVIRLREHPLYRETFQIGDFIGVLGEVFAT